MNGPSNKFKTYAGWWCMPTTVIGKQQITYVGILPAYW